MIGKAISHYRIVEKLGGGMGFYKDEDAKLDRAGAAKFLPEILYQDRDALEKFERRAKTASAPNHTKMCGICDVVSMQDSISAPWSFWNGRR